MRLIQIDIKNPKEVNSKNKGDNHDNSNIQEDKKRNNSNNHTDDDPPPLQKRRKVEMQETNGLMRLLSRE